MNRKQDFIRFWAQTVLMADCDTHIYLPLWCAQRSGQDSTEELAWLAWLTAITYNGPTALAVFDHFPRTPVDSTELGKLNAWNKANKTLLPHGADQKWFRGRLADATAGLLAVTGVNIGAFFQQRSFKEAWDAVTAINGVGRYTAWLFLQAISRMLDLNYHPNSLDLGDSSSDMNRRGVCMAMGQDEKAVKGYKFSRQEIVELETFASECYWTVSGRTKEPMPLDYFTMETAFCTFAKLFRPKNGRYLGYVCDRVMGQIAEARVNGLAPITTMDLFVKSCFHPAFHNSKGPDASQYAIYANEGVFTTKREVAHEAKSKLHLLSYL
jgi:hypothetical protein